MYRGKSVSVIMPGRSVEQVLEKQLELIPDFVDEVILVSNRSKDNTVELAKQLSQQNPRFRYLVDDRADKDGIGYGYAIQTGFAAATSDLVFKCDVDGTYPVEQLAEVIDFMLEDNLKIVSCNRYPVRKNSKVKIFNRVGVYTLNVFCWLTTGYRIKDILSGFYGGYADFIRRLHCSEGGWNYSVELKLNAITRYQEQYGEYHILQKEAQTKSHQSYWKTGWNHLSFIISNAF
jgi:glycosyltransferase involved in cell wall biosynthesis